MNIRNVTMTSKNQITLPIEYVKNLHLAQSRVLKAELLGGKIVLTPQPNLSDMMKQFWSKHNVKQALSDEALTQAVRTASAERAARV